MYFAFFYILFFAIDILAATRLQVLGMIPVHYLVAGVGFFLSVFLIKRYHFLRSIEIFSVTLLLFWGYVFLLTVFYLFLASSRALVDLGVIDTMIIVPDVIIISISSFLLLVSLFTLPLKYAISKWMLFSVIAGFISNFVNSFFSLPMILWRYSGVLDLIMLFGWLMIIVTLVRMEFAVED